MSAPSQLRPFQIVDLETIRDAFRRFGRALYQLPTGGGKTVIFVHIIAAVVARGRRVRILVHRAELIDQTSRVLAAHGVEHGVIAPGYAPSLAPVQIASVMTLVRRLASWKDAFDFLVADEAHHAVAASWQTILDAYPDARVLGVTATPERLNGRGLGEFFEELIVGPSSAELTKLGFLAPAVVYAQSQEIDLRGIHTRAGDYDRGELEERMLSGGLVGDAALHYRKLASGVLAIAFCVGIKHSLATAEAFVKAGCRARHVDGETPAEERRAAMAGLAAGEIDIITNCSLISEGFDAPAVGALLIMAEPEPRPASADNRPRAAAIARQRQGDHPRPCGQRLSPCPAGSGSDLVTRRRQAQSARNFQMRNIRRRKEKADPPRPVNPKNQTTGDAVGTSLGRGNQWQKRSRPSVDRINAGLRLLAPRRPR
jgi:superfamily II DNA or RNA helicase